MLLRGCGQWYRCGRDRVARLCLLFIHPPAHGSEVGPAARNTLDSARIPRASKLLICGLFQKGRVLAQDGNAGPEPSALIHKFFRPDAFSKSPGMIGTWHSLTRNRDFMTLFADRVNKHCFHGGALTDESSIARWRRLVDVIDSAVIAESARWGDTLAPVGQPTQTRDRSFRVEIERVIRMMTGNAEHFINVLRQAGYYPTSDPPEIDGAEGGDAVLCQNSALLK